MDLNKTNFTLDLLNTSKRTQYLTRLQTTPQVLSGYTVASHQHQCAMLYTTLATVTQSKVNSNILIALLTHDNMETFTGDLLAPAKNKDENAWNTLEAHIQCDFINGLAPDKEHNSYVASVVATLFPIEQDIEGGLNYAGYLFVKMIDLSELLLRCVDEYECGNHSERIKNCISNCVQWLRDLIEIFSSSYKDCEEEKWLLAYRRMIELLWSVILLRSREVNAVIN